MMSDHETPPDVDLAVIAKGTPGMTGADLENLVNEAAILAAREDAKLVTMKHLELAKDKILMGGERKMYLTEQEKRITAYHEGELALLQRGHAAGHRRVEHGGPAG